MKNRLELAKSLLSEDGVIFVQCDRNEFAELKLLLDETFQHSYLGTIVSISTPNGRDYGSFAQIHEYIHVFAKNIELVKTYSLEPDDLNKYSQKDNISKYYLHPLFNSNSAFHRGNRPNLFYPFYLSNEPNEHSYYSVSLTMDSRHTIEVYPPKSQTDNTQFVWRWGKDKALELANTELVGQKKSDGSFRIAQKMRPGKQIPRTVWQGAEYSNRRGTEELQTLFNKKVFAYPKPEELVKRILEIGTSEHDLVLDFHLGSGTTAAVAHKMGRRYIGVEQMDYIEDVTVARMKKVLEGEQGGISKTQNWTGGGSFVYCELKEDANTLIDTIQRATEDTIASIKASIYADDRVVPYLTKNELQHADKDFENLSLGDKKKVLITLIDKNKLYVNASDMVDENYHISDAEKAFTKSFYKEV